MCLCPYACIDYVLLICTEVPAFVVVCVYVCVCVCGGGGSSRLSD